MNMLADQARRVMSAVGVDPLRQMELARKALPKAAETVNEAWDALKEHPGDAEVRERFMAAATHHAALKDLAGDVALSTDDACDYHAPTSVHGCSACDRKRAELKRRG